MNAGNVGEVAKTIPDIIGAASKSSLGILALMIVALGVLAYFFFRDVAPRIRVGIFAALLTGVSLYAYALVKEANSTGAPSSGPSTTQIDTNPATPSSTHIRGQVFDDQNGTLAAVLVTSTDAAAASLSDSNGIFDLVVKLGAGQSATVLRFSKGGYASQTTSVRPPVEGPLQVVLSKPATQSYASAAGGGRERGDQGMPAVLFAYTVVTATGVKCENGQIKKMAAGGWVEGIPSGDNCAPQIMAYEELGQDEGWFYIFDAARNMTARIPKFGGNVNWLRSRIYPVDAATKEWNVSQRVTRIN